MMLDNNTHLKTQVAQISYSGTVNKHQIFSEYRTAEIINGKNNVFPLYFTLIESKITLLQIIVK